MSLDYTSHLPDRTYSAFACLYFLETGLREFISVEMQRSFGNAWRRQCIPNDVKLSIAKGVDQARTDGWRQLIPVDPLYFADFPDLKKVMLKKDNWEFAFKQHLRDNAKVDGLLRASESPRNKLAHNRPLTQQDLSMLRGCVAFFTSQIGEERFSELSASSSDQIDMHALLTEALAETQLLVLKAQEYTAIPETVKLSRLLATRYFYADVIERQLVSDALLFERCVAAYRAVNRQRRGAGTDLALLLKSSNFNDVAKRLSTGLSGMLGS